jgi:hypothetical protein
MPDTVQIKSSACSNSPRHSNISSYQPGLLRWAFKVSHAVVARAELRGSDDPPARGRHHELSADCEQELIEWLANKAANHREVNWTELLYQCTEGFGKSITRGWINSFYHLPCTRAF